MSHQAFRSHLMQQFAAGARNQSRPPLALAPLFKSNNPRDEQHQHKAEQADVCDDDEQQLLWQSQYYSSSMFMGFSATSCTTNAPSTVYNSSNRPATGATSAVAMVDNSLPMFSYPCAADSNNPIYHCQAHQHHSPLKVGFKNHSTRGSQICFPAGSRLRHSMMSTQALSESNDALERDGKKDGGQPRNMIDNSESSNNFLSISTDGGTRTKQESPQVSIGPTQVSHAVQSIIQTRRTTSNFLDTRNKIPSISTTAVSSGTNGNTHFLKNLKASIFRSMQCATQAPNHKHTEPWTFKTMIAPSLAREELLNALYEMTLRQYIGKEMIKTHHFNESNNNNNNHQGYGDNTQNDQATAAAIRNATNKRERWDRVPAFIAVLVDGQPNQNILDGDEGNVQEQLQKCNKLGMEYMDADGAAVKAKEEAEYITKYDDRLYEELKFVPPVTLRQMEDYAATCAAIQNILLSLHSEGVASKWSTGGITRSLGFRKIVQAKPSELVAGLVMVGIPKTSHLVGSPSLASYSAAFNYANDMSNKSSHDSNYNNGEKVQLLDFSADLQNVMGGTKKVGRRKQRRELCGDAWQEL